MYNGVMEKLVNLTMNARADTIVSACFTLSNILADDVAYCKPFANGYASERIITLANHQNL